MLDVANLSVGYDGMEVARLPSLQLARGEACLLVGPSGCGKTTLLYALAGLQVPFGGHVKVEGVDVFALGESQRDAWRGRQAGLIFQGLHLMKSVSVLDNLLLASYAAGQKQDKAQAMAALGRPGIADKAYAMPGRLSQGQAQRVAIARAVLHRPPLILADEPTASLDDDAAAATIASLRDMAREAALVIATHDSRVRHSFTQVIELGGGA